jgi:hypothetical protein
MPNGLQVAHKKTFPFGGTTILINEIKQDEINIKLTVIAENYGLNYTKKTILIGWFFM